MSAAAISAWADIRGGACNTCNLATTHTLSGSTAEEDVNNGYGRPCPEWSKKTMNCSHAQQISENVQLPTEPADNKEEDQSPVKLSTLPGAKTSDFYSVKNIPERFNHPGTHLNMCNKPSFTTDMISSTRLVRRIQYKR